MVGVANGVQQRHRHAAVAVGQGLIQLPAQDVVAPQGLQFTAVGGQAALHLQHPHLQGLGAFDVQGEQLRAVLVTDLQQIGQAAVDQQQHRGAPAFEQGIGGHSCAQPHLADGSSRDRGVRGQVQQPLNRCHGRVAAPIGLNREHLLDHQLSIRSLADHIGEGAAAVDPEPPASGFRLAHSLQAALLPCVSACSLAQWRPPRVLAGMDGISGSSRTAAAPRRPGP